MGEIRIYLEGTKLNFGGRVDSLDGMRFSTSRYEVEDSVMWRELVEWRFRNGGASLIRNKYYEKTNY